MLLLLLPRLHLLHSDDSSPHHGDDAAVSLMPTSCRAALRQLNLSKRSVAFDSRHWIVNVTVSVCECVRVNVRVNANANVTGRH